MVTHGTCIFLFFPFLPKESWTAPPPPLPPLFPPRQDPPSVPQGCRRSSALPFFFFFPLNLFAALPANKGPSLLFFFSPFFFFGGRGSGNRCLFFLSLSQARMDGGSVPSVPLPFPPLARTAWTLSTPLFLFLFLPAEISCGVPANQRVSSPSVSSAHAMVNIRLPPFDALSTKKWFFSPFLPPGIDVSGFFPLPFCHTFLNREHRCGSLLSLFCLGAGLPDRAGKGSFFPY